MARQGIAIDRATLAFWVGYAAAEIKPLWLLMREELLRSAKLFGMVAACDRSKVLRVPPKTSARDKRHVGNSRPQ